MKDYFGRQILLNDTVIFGNMKTRNVASRELTEGKVEGFRNDGRLHVKGESPRSWREMQNFYPMPTEVIIKSILSERI